MHMYIIITVLLAMLTLSGAVYPCIHYPEFRDTPQDKFYDRIVPICIQLEREKSIHVVSLGVFIDNSRIITSFNPYRRWVKDGYWPILERLHAHIYEYRPTLEFRQQNYGTRGYIRRIGCGRQIYPLKSDQNPMHGINSPKHDLMILKLFSAVKFINDPLYYHDWGHEAAFDLYNLVYVGPIKTQIAGPRDVLDRTNINICGLELNGLFDSFKNQKSTPYAFVEFTHFRSPHDVIVDCDIYISRTWGRFICIKKTSQIDEFKSSAMIFSNFKLFGIGSFTLRRGPLTLMVFTDLRPYDELINFTMTKEDHFYC